MSALHTLLSKHFFHRQPVELLDYATQTIVVG